MYSKLSARQHAWYLETAGDAHFIAAMQSLLAFKPINSCHQLPVLCVRQL